MAAPLSGRRIIDFTWAWAGPYSALLLGMLGADVIKIESRTRLDQSRTGSLALGTFSGDLNQSPMFHELNLNKRSLALNLKEPGAKQVIKDLAAISDAAIDNFRPGTLDRLGLGYDALSAVRPNFVMVSSSAVGAEGPDRNYVGYAPTFAALSGLSSLTGEADAAPTPMGGSIDLRAGTAATMAMLLALYHRDRSGHGQFVDASAREAICIHMGEAYLEVSMNHRDPPRRGSEHSSHAPHGIYACAPVEGPRWVAITCRNDREWEALCRVGGLTALLSDDRFRTGLRRWRRRHDLTAYIEGWTCALPANDVAERLTAAGVPASASVEGRALYQTAHFQARSNAVPVAPAEMEQRMVVAPPWRFSRTPAEIRKPAPSLGEDTRDILETLLGYSSDRVDELEAAGALN